MTETRTEYAVRIDWKTCVEYRPAVDRADAAIRAGRALRLDMDASAVRRTVTYGEWEPVQ